MVLSFLVLSLFADSKSGDLLSFATSHSVDGKEFLMDNKALSKADGGYYSYPYFYYRGRYSGHGGYYYNRNTRASCSGYSHRSIYARAFGSYYWGRTYGGGYRSSWSSYLRY